MEEYNPDQADNALVRTSQLHVHGNEEEKLKHLQFVETAVESMVVLVAGLYDLAKENLGPLKIQVESFEGTVKSTVGPVFDKFYHLPFQLLQLIDRKVDELIYEIDWRHHPMPDVLRRVAEKAPEVLRDLALEIHRSGLLDAAASEAKEAYIKCKPVATGLMYKYEPVVEEYAAWACRWCNGIPILSQFTQTMVPAAVFWAKRYNEVIDLTAERGLPVAGYLPSIPVERLALVFSQVTDEKGGAASFYQPTNVGGSEI